MTSLTTAASRPRGAWIRTRNSISGAPCVLVRQQRQAAFVVGDAGDDALEIRERVADLDAAFREPEFADGQLVRAGAALDHRDRLEQAAARFEKAEQQDAVGQ